MSGNSEPKSLTGIGIIESKQFGLHIHVPNAGVMECAIRDLAPVELHHPKGHDRANRSYFCHACRVMLTVVGVPRRVFFEETSDGTQTPC